MGLLTPNQGDLIIFGQKRTKEEDFFEVRKKIGLLFQDSEDQLFCPTLAEDIAFGPLNIGKSHKEAMTIVEETCEILNIRGLENRITYKLSGGQKRIAALATVIAMKPQILLLDEPTTGIDQESIDKIVNYLNYFSTSHIIISHDTDFLKRTTNSHISLRDGIINAVNN
ncbi:cobalt ABC transporter ATPase [Candidatus Magnetoovum chiemensis]|nr:cobalt ABC transporter ATPase [Candidatus Magnetoovum chiemensis]